MVARTGPAGGAQEAVEAALFLGIALRPKRQERRLDAALRSDQRPSPPKHPAATARRAQRLGCVFLNPVTAALLLSPPQWRLRLQERGRPQHPEHRPADLDFDLSDFDPTKDGPGSHRPAEGAMPQVAVLRTLAADREGVLDEVVLPRWQEPAIRCVKILQRLG